MEKKTQNKELLLEMIHKNGCKCIFYKYYENGKIYYSFKEKNAEYFIEKNNFNPTEFQFEDIVAYLMTEGFMVMTEANRILYE